MAERIVAAVADHIVSPLGFTSADNFAAVREGRSELRRYEGKWGLPEPFVAALMDRAAVLEACEHEGIRGLFTYFEKMAILSIAKALQACDVDITSGRTLLILSTTKGNVDLLRENAEGVPPEREKLGEAAKAIAAYFGNPNQPVVVSNACISGATAQIEAARLIAMGCYDSVVVCGVDVQSPFIVSGFQSLKALSAQPCRPFDEDRTGINLGDAAATIIYKGVKTEDLSVGTWYYAKGAMRNDAFHISAPSYEGEGAYRALQAILQDEDREEIAFVNAHGTGTLFNDEMESVAIDRAGLDHLPVNSLKGYIGHTMGAAGIFETILSMRAVDGGIVLGTRGYEHSGVSRELNIRPDHSATKRKAFVKLLSGFGGCNAAILFKKK